MLNVDLHPVFTATFSFICLGSFSHPAHQHIMGDKGHKKEDDGEWGRDRSKFPSATTGESEDGVHAPQLKSPEAFVHPAPASQAWSTTVWKAKNGGGELFLPRTEGGELSQSKQPSVAAEAESEDGEVPVEDLGEAQTLEQFMRDRPEEFTSWRNDATATAQDPSPDSENSEGGMYIASPIDRATDTTIQFRQDSSGRWFEVSRSVSSGT